MLYYLADTTVHGPSVSLSNWVLFLIGIIIGMVIRGKWG